MKIRKGWSKNAQRRLDTPIVEGTPHRSRSVRMWMGDAKVSYRLELQKEDGSSVDVVMTAEEVLALVLSAPAVSAMEALNKQGITFPQWLQATKSILESPAGGRPCQQ
jgi:hypothetical protein